MQNKLVEFVKEQATESRILYARENNIAQRDNLDDLPPEPAVFAICGTINGQPANPRVVMESAALRSTIDSLFTSESVSATHGECFKDFLFSIKTKTIVFLLMPGSTHEERQQKQKEWKTYLQPECNEILNKIY